MDGRHVCFLYLCGCVMIFSGALRRILRGKEMSLVITLMVHDVQGEPKVKLT